MILQNAAHPQSGGILQRVERDALAVQIGRLFDAAAGALDHVLMTKTAVRKNRNGIVAAALVARHQIADQRQLANVELFMLQHAAMAFRRRHRQNVQFDALGLNLAVDQRAQKIIIAASQGQLQFCHLLAFHMLPVKFRRIDIESDAHIVGVDLQSVLAMRIDHRLGALIQRRGE